MEQGRESSVVPEDAISESNASLTKPSSIESILVEETRALSHESVAPQNSYQIKPDFQDRFREMPVKEIIQTIQSDTLTGKAYDPDNAKKWTIKMSNEINEKIRDLNMKRYKHIVHIIMGERKGQGIKSGVRCIWDSEIDTYCHNIFMNDTIFCVVTVFAVFLY